MEFLKVYNMEDLNTFPKGIWEIKEPGLQWRGKTRQNGLYSIYNWFLGIYYETSEWLCST